MNNGDGNKPGSAEHPLSNGNVRALAERAIAVLAAETHPGATAVRRFRLSEFCDALVHPDNGRYKVLLSEFLDYGLSNKDVFEDLVPSAARLLGDRWVEDKLSFAQVTIGAARLEEIIRSVEQSYTKIGERAPVGRTILIISPASEDHTLGAIVASGLFRRQGFWVKLAIGLDDQELSVAAQETPLAFIGLSVGSQRTIPEAAKLVKLLKQSAPDTPIVIGGNIITLDSDLIAETNADLVSSDPQEIFDFCGLTPPLTVTTQE